MLSIVPLFCNSSISESIYVCTVLHFAKWLFQVKKTTFQIFCSRNSYHYDIIIL